MSTLPFAPHLSEPKARSPLRRLGTASAPCSLCSSRSGQDGPHDPDSWLELALAAGDSPPQQPPPHAVRQQVLAAMRGLGKDAVPLSPACPALHLAMDLLLPSGQPTPTLLHIEATLSLTGDDYGLSTADEALFDLLSEVQADGTSVLALRLQRSQPRPVSVRVLLDVDLSQATR